MTTERWQRSEELYHAARARPVAERAAYLVQACPDDEAMRHDVESLLNELPSDDGFLCGAAHVMAEHMAPAEMIGRTLGGYHLHALLGIGGMGEVYRARDTTLNRNVAIKILPGAFTSQSDRLARFEREAQILASLNHPHICAIHGLHEAEGLRFLVLELVEGKTLADTLGGPSYPPSRSARLPLGEVLALLSRSQRLWKRPTSGGSSTAT